MSESSGQTGSGHSSIHYRFIRKQKYSHLIWNNNSVEYFQTLGDGRVAYYAGKEGNPEQVCIVEVQPDETLYMSLFVGADSRSVYERIRNQLAPKPTPIDPDLQTTTMPMTASRPSFQAISLVLIVLLLNTISRWNIQRNWW